MPELKRWSGNDTTDISIQKSNYRDIVCFARGQKRIYVFGDGHIGKAIQKYLKDSGVIINGVLTSETIRVALQNEENDRSVIVGVGDSLLGEVMPVINEYFPVEAIYIPDAVTRESLGDILDEKKWREQFWLNIYVTNKCNLGCRSCSAFAPICKPDFYEIEEFKKDFLQIIKLGLERINELKFTGAEAMLHPYILDMIGFARKNMPDIKIEIYSNGIFIKNFDEIRLKRLAELNVVLVITEYPLPGLDLKQSYKKLDEYKISYFVIYSDEQKFFSKRPLRFEGDVDAENYIECPRYKMCRSLFLFRGKLFKCIYAISADYVNESFNKNLMVTSGDYVDIYNASASDVYTYATNRIPFCRYCSPIEERVLWGISEKKLSEWA